MSIYGPLVTIPDVRDSLTTHLRTWAPTYLAEVGRQTSTTLAPFRGFASSSGDEYPVCVTACAGISGDVIAHGDGTIRAPFAAGAAAVVSAATRDEAETLAGRYGAALRAAVLQHPDLSGFAASCEWTGETLQEVAWDTDQAIVACTVRWTIWVDAVIDTRAGPLEPPVDPVVAPGDWPTVVSTDEPVIRAVTTDTTP